VITFTLGLYYTRAAAEDGLKLWLDIYDEDTLSIRFGGPHYFVIVTLPDDPR